MRNNVQNQPFHNEVQHLLIHIGIHLWYWLDLLVYQGNNPIRLVWRGITIGNLFSSFRICRS